MIRRHMVVVMAMLVMGFVTATQAEAGGGAVGVKKTATIKIRNTCSQAVYVWIVPKGFAEPTTLAEAKKLGAILMPGTSGPKYYPIPAGEGTCYATLASLVPPDGTLPSAQVFLTYKIRKGQVYYTEVGCIFPAKTESAVADDGCVPTIKVVKKY